MGLQDTIERQRHRAVTALLSAGFVLAPAQWAPSSPIQNGADLSSVSQITFKICTGWRAWRSGDNLVVVCPGVAPPAGSIALREYYTLP